MERMGALRRTVREIGLGLITLGVIVLLFVAYQLFGTNLTEAHSQSHLAQQFHQKTVDNPTLAAPSTPAVDPSTPQGDAIDHLVIPQIGVDKYVVEGTDDDDLRKGPGHYTGTAYPGQDGNTAIAGHRTTYGAPFFRLDELTVGSPIYITDLAGRTWVYKVSQPPLVVSPDDVAVLDSTTFPQLTLTTCNPRFSATSRLIVFARLDLGAQAPAAAKSPSTTLPASPAHAPVLAGANLGTGRSGAAAPAALYGLLVVLLWVATRIAINRTRRWHRAAAIIIGIGVCLVPLWFCFENAVLLLPQNF